MSRILSPMTCDYTPEFYEPHRVKSRSYGRNTRGVVKQENEGRLSEVFFAKWVLAKIYIEDQPV